LCDRSSRRARRHVRNDRGLLPRPRGHAHLARDRRDARVPGPAARARYRVRVLTRERLRPRPAQARLSTVVAAIVVINWTYIGRIIRGQVLSLREKEFVEAARAQGASDRTILFREILPNLVAPIVVYTTLVIPQNILLEAALSYLGVGINPPQASWGEMIAEATPIFNTAWWFFAFPGAALLLTVLAFNLVGDGVRDALAPRTAVCQCLSSPSAKGETHEHLADIQTPPGEGCRGRRDRGRHRPCRVRFRRRLQCLRQARKRQEGWPDHRPVRRRRRPHRPRPGVLLVLVRDHLRNPATAARLQAGQRECGARPRRAQPDVLEGRQDGDRAHPKRRPFQPAGQPSGHIEGREVRDRAWLRQQR